VFSTGRGQALEKGWPLDTSSGMQRSSGPKVVVVEVELSPQQIHRRCGLHSTGSVPSGGLLKYKLLDSSPICHQHPSGRSSAECAMAGRMESSTSGCAAAKLEQSSALCSGRGQECPSGVPTETTSSSHPARDARAPAALSSTTHSPAQTRHKSDTRCEGHFPKPCKPSQALVGEGPAQPTQRIKPSP